MTVIVWDGKKLVGDKQATEGGILQTVTKVRKITSGKHRGWLMGASGATAQCNMMMGWFEEGADPNKFPHSLQKEDGFAAHMIAISPQGVVHKYEFVPFPIVFEDAFYASGSGRDLAIGALAMGADAVEAATVACTYCSECGVGLDVIELTVAKKRKPKIQSAPTKGNYTKAQIKAAVKKARNVNGKKR